MRAKWIRENCNARDVDGNTVRPGETAELPDSLASSYVEGVDYELVEAKPKTAKKAEKAADKET